MSTIVIRCTAALAAATLLSGCGGSEQPARPELTAPAPTSTASRTPTALPSELTAEENLRVNPPPPQHLVARRRAGRVELSWSAPPAVTVPHTYTDTVVEYRVYRFVQDREAVLLGTSRTLAFTDTSPVPGMLRYAVSSVREHGVEGARTDAVTAPPAA